MHDAHPGLPDIEYVRPATLEEASRFLAEHPGEARAFMGGTDVFVRLRDGFWPETRWLVDVKHLPGMRELRPDTVGAAVSMNRLVAYEGTHPLLAQAARTVASYPLRTRATVVGNLYNASPAGDTLGACLLLDGVLKVHGVDGFRDEPLHGFFQGPGRTVLRPGDVVTALHLPTSPEGARGVYLKLGRNALSDLALVGVTALGHPADLPSGYRFRLALASVGPVPLVLDGLLEDGPITAEALEAAAVAAMEACTPIDDVRASARYRRLMVRNLTRNALEQVWAELQGRAHAA